MVRHSFNLSWRTILMPVVSLFLCVTASAQSFKLHVPQISQFVKVKTDGATLYRQPSLNSGKLMEWNSDAGSYDTKTALFFSDTESNKYPIDPLSGSFTDKCSPYKDDILPVVPPTGNESHPGWYRVFISGRGINTKIAWIKSTVCQKITVKDIDAKTISYPGYVYLNPRSEVYEMLFGKLVDMSTASRRTTGKYTSLCFHVVYNQQDKDYDITFPIACGKFLLVARCKPVIKRSAVAKSMSLKKVVEENEMGDDDEYIQLTVPKAKTLNEAAIKQYLLKCPDTVFATLIKNTFRKDSNPVYYKNEAGQTLEYDMYCEKAIDGVKSITVTIP